MKISYSNRNRVFNIHTENIPYLSFDMLDNLGVPNLYSTRFVSYDDLKETGKEGLRVVVMKTDDINEAAPVVRANRDRLARQLSSSISRECFTDQKHTNNVYVVTDNDIGASRFEEKPARIRSVDGLITDKRDVLLTAFGGDCPPVYIADPTKKAVGLLHSGRQGTLNRISSVAVALMKERFGCDPGVMYAAIGPGICADCYEIGDEVYDSFAAEWGVKEADRILKRYPGGKYHLDLREACLMTLIKADIPADHIVISNVCTRCNADIFYSYRAHRMENEQAAMIVNRFRN